MNGLGRQLEDSEGAGESVERVLDAIEFQTAILTLNAALEAAHTAKPGIESTALTGQVRNLAEHVAERTGEAAQGLMSEPWQAGSVPPIAGPSGSTPTPGNSGAPAADSKVQARLWQEALERLRQSLAAACCADLPMDMDGRPHAENARPHPAAPPEPVPVPRRRRRSKPAQFGPRDPFARGA
jgi:hypothetical protein